MNIQDSIRPKRLMVIVQNNGIIRREPDHCLIGRLAEDVSFSDLDKGIPIRNREDECLETGAHTPGPWHYRDVIRCNGFSCYRFSNFSGSFEQWSADENREANAQLISAAPDLLACLKMALLNIEANGFDMPKVQEKIMQVIRQAEGRASSTMSTDYKQTQELALAAWDMRIVDPELATLREQVKVLREALGWLDNEMDCRDDDFGGCLFTRQDFKIARDALEQTKPKEGE